MFYNMQQVEKYLHNLGLSYEWEIPEEKGASSITVEGEIKFYPFSGGNHCTDLRTGKTKRTEYFKELCEELSNKKRQ